MKKLLAMALILLAMFCVAQAEEPIYRDVTYSTQGYSLSLHWDDTLMPDEALAKTVQDVYFSKYPAIRETFGTCEDRSFTLYVTAEGDFLSSQNSTYMTMEALQTERGLNWLVWFMASKVIGNHPNPENDPEIEALSMGLKHYMGMACAVAPEQAAWLKSYEHGQQLTDDGQVAGAFLMWVAQTCGEEVPIRLNRVLHEGYYDSLDFWLQAAGDTLGNLWNAYAAQAKAE